MMRGQGDENMDILFSLLSTFSFALTFILTYFITSQIIKKEKELNIVWKDMNKKGDVLIPNVGGIAIFFSVILVLSFVAGTCIYLGQKEYALALSCAIGSLAVLEVIGLYDDFFRMRQVIKAFLPGLASFPLLPIILKKSILIIPFLGACDVGLFYPLFFVPIGLMGASNLANMLAGYNGLESGLGIIIFCFLSLYFFMTTNIPAFIFSLIMLSALLAFFFFNKYPSKVFPGDAGTLLIGGAVAIAVIIGGAEAFGALLMLPYLLDFAIKAANKFPSDMWWGEVDEKNRLHSPEKPRGLMQLLLKLIGPIEENKLVFIMLFVQFLWAIIMFGLFVLVF